MNSKSAVQAAGLAIALALSGIQSARAEGLPLPELKKHLGAHLVLVIDTPDPSSSDYKTQAAALLPDWAGLLERDLAIVTQMKATRFRVRLVGKDGGVKLDSSTPVAAAALFALIDAMPMRRQEVKSRK